MTRTTTPRSTRRPSRGALGLTALAAVAAVGLSACGSANADAANDKDDKEPTNAEVMSWFDDWNAALATGDADKVAAEYTTDGVLLSTLSTDIREGRTEIAEYFENDFLPKNPQGVITESIIKVLDDDTVIHDGLYDFTVTGADGATSVVPARFTFVYEKEDGEWLIKTQHSSAQPD